MEKQKNIDNLFQEKLKGLDLVPNEKVWNSIETKLQKKKRKILPIWWVTSGVAALFIFGLLLFPWDEKNTTEPKFSPINNVTKSAKEKENSDIKNDVKTIIVKSGTKIEDKIKVDKKVLNPTENKEEKVVAKVILNKDENEKQISTKNTNIKGISVDNTSKNEAIIAQHKNSSTAKNNTENHHIKIDKNANNSNLKKTDLVESIAKNTTDLKEEKIQNKWSVATVFGVIGANSFSKTSPLDSNLNGSTKGDNSLSYGVQFSYKINNKWSLQSGVHKQEIQYTNNNVAIVASNIEASNINFNSGDRFVLNSTTKQSFNANSLSLNTLSFNGNMQQNIGYIEIPLEIKYKMFENNNLETQIVTGFSSLFLNRNEVFLNTDNLQKTGEASNVNNFNFSGNLGVDFKYSFNKSWSLQLNPMFKTQLNTFNKNSNGFQPYFIAVYTGINFKF